MGTSWLPRVGFVKHPRRLNGESPLQRLRDGFTMISRRDHCGGFMKPFFKAFVNLQMGSTTDPESLQIAEGYLNH